MPGAGEHDPGGGPGVPDLPGAPGPFGTSRPAVGRARGHGPFRVPEQRGRRARRFGQPQQQLQVGQDRDRVLPLHHRVRPQRRPQTSHRGHRVGPRAGDAADGQAERPLGQRQDVVPVAAAARPGAVPHRQPYARHPRQPGGQQLLAHAGQVGAGTGEVEPAGDVLGGVSDVQTEQMTLALGRLRRFVVQPDGRAHPAGALGHQRHGVAGGVAEPGGDLAVARVETGLLGDVGVGDLPGPGTGLRQTAEEVDVGGGVARDGFEVSEVRDAQAEPEGGGRAEGGAVGRAAGGVEGEVVEGVMGWTPGAGPGRDRGGRLQGDQSAPGAHEGGPGVQGLAHRPVQGLGARQPFGEVVEGGEVGDPSGEPVLDGGEPFDRVRQGRVLDGRRARGDGGLLVRGGGGRNSLLGWRCGRVDSGQFRWLLGAHGRRPSP